ncbi:MAG: hypothetical protein ACLSGQ_13665 [Parabacteroides distasonis]
MELKDFISETLSQIIDGVTEVQAKYKEKNVLINPDKIEGSGGEYYISGRSSSHIHTTLIQNIEMDVAITATEGNENKVGIGVAKILNIGTSRETNAQNTTLSRIKFSIPVSLPTTSTDEYMKKNGLAESYHM